MDRVNELSTQLVEVAFFDERGAEVTPDSARYRLDDDPTGQAVVAWTAMSGLGTTAEILVTHAQNAVLDERRAVSVRRLTVEFTYATTKKGMAEYQYELVNLRFAP